jgi:hypothetical protein
MSQDPRFYPAFIADPSLTPEFFEALRRLCDGAPSTHGGRFPVMGVSRQILISEDAVVLPIEGIATHRDLSGPIAGIGTYDEITAEEQDHFEPLFRLFWQFPLLRNAPARGRARHSPTQPLVEGNRGLRLTCAYFRSFCAVFPSDFSARAARLLHDAGHEGAWRFSRTGPQADRRGLCSVIVPVPASNHAAMEHARQISRDWTSLRAVINGYSNYDSGDPELDAFCVEDFHRARN